MGRRQTVQTRELSTARWKSAILAPRWPRRLLHLAPRSAPGPTAPVSTADSARPCPPGCPAALQGQRPGPGGAARAAAPHDPGGDAAPRSRAASRTSKPNRAGPGTAPPPTCPLGGAVSQAQALSKASLHRARPGAAAAAGSLGWRRSPRPGPEGAEGSKRWHSAGLPSLSPLICSAAVHHTKKHLVTHLQRNSLRIHPKPNALQLWKLHSVLCTPSEACETLTRCTCPDGATQRYQFQ